MSSDVIIVESYETEEDREVLGDILAVPEVLID